MEATLSAHKSTLVTRDQLASIPTPDSTATWRPIAHAELVEIMHQRLNLAGWNVVREQYAVQSDGRKLFGTFDLGGLTESTWGTALGFRHGNDKTMSLQIVTGARVFVCDNLALVGDATVLRYRHRHGVYERLRESLGRYFGGLSDAVNMVKDRFGVWRAASLQDDDAKVLIYDAVHQGIIPSRLRPDIHYNYFGAEALGFEDCAPRNKYGLHNAFTRAFKSLNPGPAYEANVGVTALLG